MRKLLLQFNRPLLAMVPLHLLLLAVFAIAPWVDPRTLLGESVWVKPAKFAASIAVYAGTLAWLLGHVEGRARAVRRVSLITVATGLIEMALVALQAGRGVRSHFNGASPLDLAIYDVMGVSILALTGAGVWAAVLLFRQGFADPVVGRSVRAGIVVMLAAASLGGLMTTPRKAQLAAFQEGAPLEVGSHTVGARDGGPGLPGVGWSTQAGDLRVPHFAGLHALQVLPLLGLWLSRRRIAPSARMQALNAAILGYAGSVALLTLHALRGESLVSPGTSTLAGFAALGLACAGVLLWPARAPAPQRIHF